jgi:hypothetical protein
LNEPRPVELRICLKGYHTHMGKWGESFRVAAQYFGFARYRQEQRAPSTRAISMWAIATVVGVVLVVIARYGALHWLGVGLTGGAGAAALGGLLERRRARRSKSSS